MVLGDLGDRGGQAEFDEQRRHRDRKPEHPLEAALLARDVGAQPAVDRDVGRTGPEVDPGGTSTILT